MRKSTINGVSGKLVGYARVSTVEQNLDMQIEALRRAGVALDRIHVEKLSATNKRRPKLEWALSNLRAGDTLVVWKLDRIARSLTDMLNRIQQIEECGAGFKSLTEQIDTTTPAGRLLLHVIGSLAQFERDLVVQRTRAGVAAAKARGVKFGQPRKLDDKQIAQCRKWKKEGRTVREIRELAKQQYNVRLSQQTVWKYTR
jgi:DNA invertase Pin-like site-specific DNA recombinase